uniref:Uncharacterized protein n=1 Tax=Tetranychus urticae TaxID=32264 RepID=T1K1K9_TETUR
MIKVNLWVIVSLLSIGSVKCLIGMDLAELANRLPHHHCRALVAVLMKISVYQVNSGCFFHLIAIRKDFKVRYGEDGDYLFLGNLTASLDALGLSGSSVKLISENLEESLIAANQYSFSKVHKNWVKQKAEADAHAIVENPFKAVQRHHEQAQLSSETTLNVVIFVCLIAMAAILTYVTFKVIFNLGVPAGAANRDEAVLYM